MPAYLPEAVKKCFFYYIANNCLEIVSWTKTLRETQKKIQHQKTATRLQEEFIKHASSQLDTTVKSVVYWFKLFSQQEMKKVFQDLKKAYLRFSQDFEKYPLEDFGVKTDPTLIYCGSEVVQTFPNKITIQQVISEIQANFVWRFIEAAHRAKCDTQSFEKEEKTLKTKIAKQASGLAKLLREYQFQFSWGYDISTRDLLLKTDNPEKMALEWRRTRQYFQDDFLRTLYVNARSKLFKTQEGTEERLIASNQYEQIRDFVNTIEPTLASINKSMPALSDLLDTLSQQMSTKTTSVEERRQQKSIKSSYIRTLERQLNGIYTCDHYRKIHDNRYWAIPNFSIIWHIQNAIANIGTILVECDKPITVMDVRDALGIQSKNTKKNLEMDNNLILLQNCFFPKKH